MTFVAPYGIFLADDVYTNSLKLKENAICAIKDLVRTPYGVELPILVRYTTILRQNFELKIQMRCDNFADENMIRYLFNFYRENVRQVTASGFISLHAEFGIQVILTQSDNNKCIAK